MKIRPDISSLAAMLLIIAGGGLFAAPAKALPDLVYAEVGGKKLLLDLYIPEGVVNPPLVVTIHGGGWRSGSRKPKQTGTRDTLLKNGFAVASIEYRLSNEAVFPAQIHDCKGAVRWLRAHASEYGYDGSRIAAFGGSAGGYLALLLGLTGGDPQLEGDVGGNLDQSSKVSAVVDLWGPTDFVLRAQDQPWETEKTSGKVYQLLGGPVKENMELARQASPANHVSAGDPPLLVFHGTADRTVLMNQSERLRDACAAANVPMEFHVIKDLGHGDPDPKKVQPGTEPVVFGTPENHQFLIDFLKKNLKDTESK